MNREAVAFMNWLCLFSLLPATVILAWKLVTLKLKGKPLSPDITTVSLVLVSAIIGWTELNISDGGSRFAWALRVVQLIVLVFLHKSLWFLWKQRLRD